MSLQRTIYVGASILACGVVLATVQQPAFAEETDRTETSLLTEKASATVSNFSELSTALQDIVITDITITNDIIFTNNINTIPQRNIKINGSNNLINLGAYHITGRAGTQESIFEITNTKFTSNSSSSYVFSTTDKNWNVLASNINFTGGRFVEVPNSTLTFEENNVINTSAENAWVHNLIFSENSVYQGTSASAGQYSAFYFNGNYVDGKVDGRVTVNKNADVNIVISPNNDNYYYYPAFYDKVSRVDVKEEATLTIDAAGSAIHFANKSNYNQTPSLNISSGASVDLVGRGGGNYPTINYAGTGNITVSPKATFNVTGSVKNTTSPIITMANNSAISLDSPDYFSFSNKTHGAPLFNAVNTALRIKNTDLSVWEKVGGDYDTPPLTSWTGIDLTVNISGNSASVIDASNPDLAANFKLQNYGKISGENVAKPTINQPHKGDSTISGTGVPGAKIDIKLKTTSETFSKTVTVNASGVWTIDVEELSGIEVLESNWLVSIIQILENGNESSPVESTVI